MPLTPQQVAEKKFTSTRFKNGYDETEVDAFLDEVEAELTRLHDENASLRAQLDAARSGSPLQAPAAPAQPVDRPAEPVAPSVPSATQTEMEELLRRTLLLGQRTADEAVAEARAEADRIRTEATQAADLLRGETERRIAELERSSAIRHSAVLAEQEAAHRRLQDEIAALRAFESEYRGRLRSYLELQLRDLDAAELSPPGPSGGAEQEGATGSSGQLGTRPAPSEGAGAPEAGAEDRLPELPPLPDWSSPRGGNGEEESPFAPFAGEPGRVDDPETGHSQA